MTNNHFYEVPHVDGKLDFEVAVPGSKSITNRALLIAALCGGPVRLRNVLWSDDSRHFLKCLSELGYPVELDEARRQVTITGQSGRIAKSEAQINVGSAGTAARFITAFLAASPGRYTVQASPQMAKRPMKPLIDCLRDLGVQFTFLETPDAFPFIIEGTLWKGGRVTLKAEQSSQFLSALLLVGCLAEQDLEIAIAGELPAKPYVEMTTRMMADFGVHAANKDFRSFLIPGGQRYRARESVGSEYTIEPDVSNACYFWAMAALTGGSARVDDAHFDSLQGDMQFLDILKRLGCTVTEEPEGIRVIGPPGGRFPGIDADMGAIPDQTLTLAVLAAFAESPTVIRNVGLIKFHETNRLRAIVTELTKAGIRAVETDDGLMIHPGKPHAAELETYDDHRMAMALSLLGLKVPGIRIKDPECTAKTFPEYFEVFNRIVTAGRLS